MFGLQRPISAVKTKKGALMADSKEDFKKELQERLGGIERAVAECVAGVRTLLDRPTAAPATNGNGGGGAFSKAQKLTEIQTKTFKIVKVYDDMAGAAQKWNCAVTDDAGTKYRIGTFNKTHADNIKLAAANKQTVDLTFGKNRNGYYELVSVS